ncbi:hypothetical protein DM47_3875 [Burkholderia mallei]|nr:hypothetical protein DM46_3700 [Burkholderia mallei]KOS97632.1 hypothetical protein DM49_2843 [Burkholderia mallei]KOT12679.1 hypothetical protein DM77_3805 [Burkholderia mallei]KOT22894.1 hypothetical protein DM47_3875 [Burkholderia mallei]KOT25436.1 hypothetical protein DM52_4468 [Burkholderia mallei]
MFEPKKRRTPLPCSSRRRPVARAASPRTAFACKERTSGGVIAGRRGGAAARASGTKAAGKRQETARRFMHQSGNRPHHGAPGMSCMEACARRTSGFRRQSDRRRTPARYARELRGRPRHRVRTAASRVRGGGKGKRRARGCACQQARVRQASRRTRDAARRNAAQWTSERDGKKRQKPKRRAYGRAGMFNPRATAGRATNASSARATFG